ncbi:MAG TPA: hypothetical protein VFU24_15955 [Burkholderiales bacterium]|nr:hypothetical protein [Burkholderiales bacterium]
MNRIPFILSAITIAFLAGCATESGITSAPAPAPVVVAPVAAPVAATPAAPTYSVGAAGTTVVVPNANPASTAVTAPAMAPLRVGFGRIDSILVVPNAAAGGTAPSSKRVAMRMDDGTLQHFETKAEGLAVGDRIEITTNGTMRHPA